MMAPEFALFQNAPEWLDSGHFEAKGLHGQCPHDAVRHPLDAIRRILKAWETDLCMQGPGTGRAADAVFLLSGISTARKTDKHKKALA